MAKLVATIALSSVVVALVMSVLMPVVGHIGGAATAGKAAPIVLSPLANRSVIYDRKGGEMAVLYGSEDREEVPLAQVPQLLQKSVIGIEDRDFYTHNGVSIRALGRALSSNLSAGGITQGGSTITQQLIKNSILGSEQTLNRKIKEAALAVQLEKQMSKKDILERYLNTIYLGHGAYGVEAGAETYFNTTVDKLTWPQAALLTALIRNPVGYDPINYPKLAAARVKVVADRLHQEKVIDAATEKQILAAPLPTQTYSRAKATSSFQLAGANYYSEEVKQELLGMPQLGATSEARYNAVFGGGLRVTTEYDPAAQAQAERAVKTLPNTNGKFQAALSAIDPKTGAVRAVVGGLDFDTQQINLATQGWRQPGSSFKYFVLMAAFENGVVPGDTITGASPCKFKNPGSPNGVYVANNAESGGGVGTITSQAQASSNCAFLRLGQAVGLDKVAAMANSMGMTTLNPKVDANGKPVLDPTTGVQESVEGPIPSDILSLPIGSKEVHPLMMAAAYAAADNDGVWNAPFFIDKVTDASGKVLYQHQAAPQRVVSSQTARLVTQVLTAVVTGGTGTTARLPNGRPAAGKTGTTQDHADAWFVGFTPQLVTSVWIGSPTNRDTLVLGGKTQFGADYPAKIWKNFMTAFHSSLPIAQFPKPDKTRSPHSVRFVDASNKTGNCKASTPSTRSSTRSTTTLPPILCSGGAGIGSTKKKTTTTLPGGAPATGPAGGTPAASVPAQTTQGGQ